MNVLAFGFPNPVSWVWDKAGSMLSDTAGAVIGWSFEKVIGGLVAWVLDGVSWAVGAIFGFIDSSTSPKVTADWFVGSDAHAGPYRMMLTIAAGLLLLFVFAGLIQGILAGDTAGMLRRITVDLPMAVAGMVSLVAVTQILITLTDQLSAGILSAFGGDVRTFLDHVAAVGTLSGGVATALVVFLLGLGTLLAALVIFVELVIRSALIYLVVGLCPLAFAALVWPATRGVLRRTLELLAALILSKLVVALALSIGAAALGGAMDSAPAPNLSPPTAEVSAPTQSDAATVTSAAGVLLAGLATFAVACFSPFVVLRLFPLVETAVVAQGLRGGPMRTAQSAVGMKAQLDVARRYGGAGTAAGTSASAGAGAASAAGPAAAGAAVATAAAGAVRRVADGAAAQTPAGVTPKDQTPPDTPRRRDPRNPPR